MRNGQSPMIFEKIIGLFLDVKYKLYNILLWNWNEKIKKNDNLDWIYEM